MRYVFKKAREFIENAPAMNGFILGRYGDQIGVETDDEIDAFVRQTVYVSLHPPFNQEADLVTWHSNAVQQPGTQPRRRPCPNSGPMTA